MTHATRSFASTICVGLAIGLLTSGCGAKTGLEIDRFDAGMAPSIDATIPPIDARDSAPADAPDAPFCLPGMPCDCFTGGEVSWEEVLYLVTDSTTIGGYGDPGEGWGHDMRLEARCAGTYTITATVVATGGSHCEVASIPVVATIRDPRFGTRARMPRWVSNNACANEALTETGGETCLSIAWDATGGGSGSVMLGCFAAFGPYCFGGPGCGTGGMGMGASGSWEF